MMPVKDLVKSLWEESEKGKGCCPFIRYDGECCKCTSTNPNFICDTASLQLWCLDKERYRNCIFYRDKENESH